MLQTTDGRRRLSPTLHAAVFALLVISAAAASTLRQRAHSDERGPDDVRIANNKGAAIGAFDAVRTTGEGGTLRPSIDLSYLPEAKQGLVSIRPEAVFAHAEMQPVTALLDAAIRRKLSELGVDEAAAFSIAQIEQAVGPVVIEVLDPHGAPGERGRLMVGLSAIRSENRLPVKEVLEATHSDTTIIKNGSATIIETPEAAIPAFGPMRHFAMPDDHTVLPGISGQALTKLAERPVSEQISAKPWFKLWQAVEQDMFAVVLDNSGEDWNGPWHSPMAASARHHFAEFPEAKTLAAHTKHFALGCDLHDDKLKVQLIVECTRAADADVVVESLQSILQRSIREVEKQSPASQAVAGVHSIRIPDKNPANESLDIDYLRRLYVSMLQTLAQSQPAVDAGRVSLEASVDVEVSTVAALAVVLAGELGASNGAAGTSAE